MPILCLYDPSGTAKSGLATQATSEAGIECFKATTGSTAGQALLACARANPGRDIVLLARGVHLPTGWWERLCAARTLAYDVISPLSNACETWNPLVGSGSSRSLDAADACLWMLGEAEPIPVNGWLPDCCLWRGERLAQLPDTLADGELPVGFQATVLDHLWVEVKAPSAKPNTPPPCPPALESLRTRIAALGQRTPVAVGRDNVPVVLHIVHGWGGGVQHFVASLMRASHGFRHLALVAKSNDSGSHAGEALWLFDDLASAPIARWPLANPIVATQLASNEYARILDWIVQRYRVGRILVSSLIGHSLEALRTGLPTDVVCHDYYPLWPRLHADFGDPSKDFSTAAIATALKTSGRGFQFGESRPQAWQALRENYVSALLAAKARLFHPSQSVRNNIERIEPRLSTLEFTHVPHGIEPWGEPVAPVTPPERTSLRVLVLGRIDGGKGADLLTELLPLLDPGIELVLLGAGRAGMAFFGRAGVHLCLDYSRPSLPGLIRQFAPDLALMPATVAETFSYTLSELWSLGVPVLATTIGSLGERIQDGDNGLLEPVNAQAIATRLNALLHQRSQLEALRQIRPQPGPESMAQTYEASWNLSRARAWPIPFADPLQTNRRHQLEHLQQELSAQLDEAQARLQSQQDELVRRGHWGDALQTQLDERTRWAKSLESDLESACGHVERLTGELDERGQVVRQQEIQLGDLHQTLEQTRGWLQSAVAHGDAMQHDRDQILASHSWRLTAPLREGVRVLARWRARLAFRWQRLKSLHKRTLTSLRSRGLNGTAARIRDELRPPSRTNPATPLPIPDATIDPAGIQLPSSDTPVASIVIPVYNHLDATLLCLASLAQTRNRTAHEIIVVDDCSSDASAEVLPTIAGLRYQRNAENLGFIGACNAGAANARGQFVVFLNNDTAVQDGWLDALIDTFTQHQNVGLVGAKLVYPDGRLQEAGGIVFADGSGWNYGRFDDPVDPRYNFVREVDYCSGAAIALPTALFRQFGGFDSYYAPAYYEDTDLAMKVRAAGLRVLYQPASVVVHFEGISSGTDTTSGTKRYQVINKEKFFARWQKELAQHPSPSLGTQAGVAIARQHRVKKRVLVIDATTPQPDHDSGSVRLVNILRLLLEEGCAVSFFADNRAFVETYSPALQQLGVEVLWHPYLSDPVTWFEDNGQYLDLVFISRHYIVANYLELVRQHARKARLVFDTVDLHYLREQRAAELEGSAELARAAEKTRERELALIQASDVTVVVSPVEKALLAREAPEARVEVVSNVHELAGCRRGFAERKGIWFVGGYQHPPNVDAAVWFAHEILPLIQTELPDLVFHLVGSKAPPQVKALGDLPGIQFHGFVHDIEPFLDGCRLAVAPLRYGAGVKGKVNMSMSYGQPVVATPIAVEGMFAEAGRDVLVAQTPADFAAEVIRAYRDPVLWDNLSARGLANVERHFSFAAARASIRNLLFDTPISNVD